MTTFLLSVSLHGDKGANYDNLVINDIYIHQQANSWGDSLQARRTD